MAKTDPYKLDPGFEARLVLLLCSDPQFYARIGKALDPDGLGTAAAQLAAKGAKAIAAERGEGPSSELVVLQRLRRWMERGDIKLEDVLDVADFFDLADTTMAADEVVEEVAPLLQRRAHKAAVRKATEVYSKRGDMNDIVALLQGAGRIGLSNVELGSAVDATSLEHVRKLRNLTRMATGIPDLDSPLRGGSARTEMGVVIGGAGDGKSMFLNQIFCAGMRQGATCAYATLELGKPFCFARVTANLTGVETDDIIDGSGEELAEARLQKLIGAGLGRGFVREFTAHATTVGDIEGWVEELERVNYPVDLLVVDYGDKLAHSEKGDYTGMRQIFEGLRIIGVQRNLWVWTASQAKRKDSRGGRRLLDLNDGADSQHKVRVADIVITLNVGDEGEIEFYVAKNRNGKASYCVGPVPTQFECARIAPLSEGAPADMDALGHVPF